MITVLRESGFRVVIFSDDHEPAHVHAYADGEAKINLSGPGNRPQLVWAVAMTRADIRRCMKLVEDHQTALLARWKQIHG
jgi:hypothetical protein